MLNYSEVCGLYFIEAQMHYISMTMVLFYSQFDGRGFCSIFYWSIHDLVDAWNFTSFRAILNVGLDAFKIHGQSLYPTVNVWSNGQCMKFHTMNEGEAHMIENSNPGKIGPTLRNKQFKSHCNCGKIIGFIFNFWVFLRILLELGKYKLKF